MRHDEEVQKCVYGLAVGPVNSVDFVISMSDDAGCRVDLRVGVIKKAWRHPEADTLYVEEVEVGEATPRQVSHCTAMAALLQGHCRSQRQQPVNAV